MQILHTVAEMRRAVARVRDTTLGAPFIAALPHAMGGATTAPNLGLVPTMGALHEGHLSLVRTARRSCRSVAVSIFVNPTQFAAGEDLDRYPRTFDADCALLEREGVDLVFAPTAEEMYPPGGSGTFIEVPGLSERLDGATRPGHFRGVATVVAKLFHIVAPDLAFFGQKDAAQVAVLQAMVRDLNLPVGLRICPTVRDADGLALSSRNRFLSPAERRSALALPQALHRAESLIAAGNHAAEPLRAAMLEILNKAPGLRLDYAEIVDPDTLQPVSLVHPRALIAVAAWVGTTRLIDNVLTGERA
jgi:pantoate--beta-alanine ligase